MTLLHVIVIALVQGITEFLPISSSGHLILVPTLTGWPDQGLLIDVAAHVGTLGAVLVYFWRDTRGLTLALLANFGVAPARRAIADTIYGKLFWLLIISTLPVIVIGVAVKSLGWFDLMRTAEVIGWASIVFGLLLYWADKSGPVDNALERMAVKPALIIGLAQVLALIPGTSRAGITMTAARWLGFSRTEAARFSMLLSIPTILGAGILGAVELVQEGSDTAIMDGFFVAVLSGFVAFVAIHFFMRWLTHASMTIFVVYRLLLGAGLLAAVYMGYLI